jgi:hypothetical protein
VLIYLVLFFFFSFSGFLCFSRLGPWCVSGTERLRAFSETILDVSQRRCYLFRSLCNGSVYFGLGFTVMCAPQLICRRLGQVLRRLSVLASGRTSV